MMISLIAAMTKDRVIGQGNRIPWHLPEDFKYFKKTTLGKPIVMGRKTFESASMGKPLPGRQNIVLTRDKNWQAEGCDVVHSVEEALNVAQKKEEIMIIGGTKIYEAFLPKATRLYLSLVEGDYQGDIFFPEIKEEEWELISEEQKQGFKVQVLERKKH